MYDAAGRRWKEILPDSGVVETTYDLAGRVKLVSGARTYPVEYDYDVQGRLKTMKTWKDYAGNGGVAVTTWGYEPETGRLKQKVDADGKGAVYSYTAGGRLETRMWARGVVTTYSYQPGDGLLAGVDYGDGTPDVGYSFYNRRGQPGLVVDGSGTRQFVYEGFGGLKREQYILGAKAGYSVESTFDGLLQRTGLVLKKNNTTHWSAGYGYENGRLATVSGGGSEHGYVRDGLSGRLQRVEHRVNGLHTMNTRRLYDGLGRLREQRAEAVSGIAAPVGVKGMGYGYNVAGQRVFAGREDGSHWDYGYDALGQVSSGVRRTGTVALAGDAVAGESFGYGFDDIGNREVASVDGVSAGYVTNGVNAYTSRVVPGYVDVMGSGDTDATVTVNDGATVRGPGGRFYRRVPVGNGAGAVSGEVTVRGVRPGAGANGADAVGEEKSKFFVAQSPENFSYDDDGNLTLDGHWSYAWDGENRLVRMTQRPGTVATGATREQWTFAYDSNHRRVRRARSVEAGSGITVSWAERERWVYHYDGWNLIGEEHSGINPTINVWETSAPQYYLWGEDLSGSEQGAGGVGGLLGVVIGGTPHVPAYDGNGNILALYRLSDRLQLAAYEYGPFGEPLRITGPLAKKNPFRWSTKYTDETGLVYYGYRYYSPSMGRWVNRDPIGERGGRNLYGMVGNRPNAFIDPFGNNPWKDGTLVSPAWVPTQQNWERTKKDYVVWSTAAAQTEGAYFISSHARMLMQHYLSGNGMPVTIPFSDLISVESPLPEILENDRVLAILRVHERYKPLNYSEEQIHPPRAHIRA